MRQNSQASDAVRRVGPIKSPGNLSPECGPENGIYTRADCVYHLLVKMNVGGRWVQTLGEQQPRIFEIDQRQSVSRTLDFQNFEHAALRATIEWFIGHLENCLGPVPRLFGRVEREDPERAVNGIARLALVSPVVGAVSQTRSNAVGGGRGIGHRVRSRQPLADVESPRFETRGPLGQCPAYSRPSAAGGACEIPNRARNPDWESAGLASPAPSRPFARIAG